MTNRHIAQNQHKYPSGKPRLMRFPAASHYSGLSRSDLYRRSKRPPDDPGWIKLVKCNGSTLVDVATLDAALDSLPQAPSNTSKMRETEPAAAA
jgi:hypothetical protein